MDHQKLIQDDQDSYGSTDSMEETPVLNLEDLGKNIEKIQMNCRFLEKGSKTIGSTKDNAELREKIQCTLLECKNLIAQTNKKIQPLIIANYIKDTSLKLQVQRLKDHFMDVVATFHKLQQALLIKLKRNLPTEPCPINNSEHRNLEYLYDDDEQVTSQQSYQKTLEDQQEIIEREDKFLQLESDITDINDIMRDLANLTNAQGNAVDSIENAVSTAYDNIERGRRELEKATERAHRGYKNIICLFVMLILISSTLAVMLYFTLRQN